MTDGFGNITWWGFSPSIDLQEDGLYSMKYKITIIILLIYIYSTVHTNTVYSDSTPATLTDHCNHPV